jgi:hypothetical protein
MKLISSEVALGQVAARARVLVHEVPRAEELAEWRRAHSADHAGLEEHRAWYVRATRGLVVKYVDAVELRVVVVEVLSVGADAAPVAQHLLKLGALLVTALTRLHARNLERKSSLKVGSTREKKGG